MNPCSSLKIKEGRKVFKVPVIRDDDDEGKEKFFIAYIKNSNTIFRFHFFMMM